MKRRVSIHLLLVCLLAAPFKSKAQQSPVPLDAAARKAVIDSIIHHIQRAYVLEEKVTPLVQGLKQRDKKGAYSGITDPKAFADTLTRHLQAISTDRHLGVYHEPETYRDLRVAPDSVTDRPGEERERAEMIGRNYGFNKVEMLEGNIGYIDLRMFEDVDQESGARAVAAMAFVADAEAVIIDVRRNPGGSGRMGQLISTYFFSTDEDHWLVSNANRSKGTDRQEWTLPYVPGRRMPGTPLYILTSKNTGSAAEGFAYNLQALGRAIVVGEATYGAAHSGDMVVLANDLVMFLPEGRTHNPITGSNWEGTGVQPDLPVEKAAALERALLDVIEKKSSSTNAGSKEQEYHEWRMAYLRAKIEPVKVSPDQLAQYAGGYEGDRTIHVIGERIYLSRKDGPLQTLMPLSDNMFVHIAADHYGVGNQRVSFVQEDGQVKAMRTLVRHQPLEVAEFDDARVGE